MRRVAAVGFLVGLGAAPPAWADAPVVAEPERQPLVLAAGEPSEPTVSRPWTPPEERRWHDGVALGVSFGPAWVENAERGWYGRLDAGAYQIETRRRGVIGGMLIGLEGWGAKALDDSLDKGGSVPVVFYGGLQSDAFFAALGAGFELVLVDQVAHDTGVGFFAPVADAYLGVDLEGVRFLLNARPGYRWQFGADDRGMLRAGLTVQLTTD